MFILSVIPIGLQGNQGSVNPSDRLAEVRSKIAVAEQRVQDLEALLTFAILQYGGPGEISGFSFDTQNASAIDANVVRQELYRARAFEGELRTAEQFWNQIVESNKQAESKTHDHFKSA